MKKIKVWIKQVITDAEFPTEISLEANLYKDGDQWCCMIGENIHFGVAGFGKDPQGAMYECAEKAGMVY